MMKKLLMTMMIACMSLSLSVNAWGFGSHSMVASCPGGLGHPRLNTKQSCEANGYTWVNGHCCSTGFGE